MPDYMPYVNAYGGIPILFQRIKAAAVPPKFNVDFLGTVLDMKSSSYRAMIPLLKKLGFIDMANVPTQAYKDFREDSLSAAVMAERLRDAYRQLFQANEYAWKLSKDELNNKVKSLTGAGDDDPVIPAVTGTFMALSKLAQWDAGSDKKAERRVLEKQVEVELPASGVKEPSSSGLGDRLRLSYTINLNLPATTEIEVFNAIFKSLRENMLREI